MKKKLNHFFKLQSSLIFLIFTVFLFSNLLSLEFNNYVFAQNESSDISKDPQISDIEVNIQELDSLQKANLEFSYQYNSTISDSYAYLESMVEEQGTVRVIIGLDIPVMPEGELDGPQAIQNPRQMIQNAQQNMLNLLSESVILSTDTYQFKHIPYVSTVIDASSLSTLQSSPYGLLDSARYCSTTTSY